MYVSLKWLNPKKLYDRIPKKQMRVVPILGTVILLMSIMMIPSLVTAMVKHEALAPFLWPMVIGFILGSFIKLRFVAPKNLCPADGLVMMFCMWIVMFVYGTIPFIMSGMTFFDAFFESVSGFSTTGASIIPDVTVVPHSVLVWRIISNWMGGIIIVMMFMFIIPMVVSGGRSLLNNEMSGSGGSNLSVKLGNAAKQFIMVYIVLTAIFAVVYILLGMNAIDGISLAMSVISIGGFVNVNGSLSSYSVAIKLVTAVFLILSASNFYLHFRAVVKRDFGYRKSEEFRVMILWFLFVMVFIGIQCVLMGQWSKLPGDDMEKLTAIVFTVTSLGTTAGFTSVDIGTYWSFLSSAVFLLLMFIGGSSGSTSGGIKINRAIVVFKSMINEIRHVVHPNAVYNVKYERHGLYSDTVHSAMVLTIIFLIVIVIASMVFGTMYGLDESVFTAVSLLTNTGTTIGELASDYSGLPDWAKMFACLLMFLGRMEVLTILAMFTPDLWKEFFGPSAIESFKDTVSFRKYRDKIIHKGKGKDEGKDKDDASFEDDDGDHRIIHSPFKERLHRN